ncbi:MAG: ABC transporter ATP-binding protein, partial [Desulfobacula sp.]|nr:ABC transporter ATP-binding protein [Desulfobacula sp.]
FSYPDKTRIFSNFNWNTRQNESWSVLGLSGSGKTTLLYLLAGLIKADTGQIDIAGSKIKRVRPETGFIMQNHGLLPWAKVKENIQLGFKIRKFYGPDKKHAPKSSKSDKIVEKKALDYWLDRLSISSIQDKYPSQISGGQKQRVAIARTMVLKPDLLLMDEPFASLDIKTRDSLQNLILKLDKDNRQSRILVTHNLEEAVYLGSKILVITGQGLKPEIFENPGAGSLDYKNSSSYSMMCDKLKDVLESVG